MSDNLSLFAGDPRDAAARIVAHFSPSIPAERWAKLDEQAVAFARSRGLSDADGRALAARLRARVQRYADQEYGGDESHG